MVLQNISLLDTSHITIFPLPKSFLSYMLFLNNKKHQFALMFFIIL